MGIVVLLGFALGFLGSMPVAGPLAILVFHLGLNHDTRHARFVALGGALAEGLYVLLAFWGLSAILHEYPIILFASRWVGAGICLILGLVLLLHRTRTAPAPEPGGPSAGRGTKRSFLGGFLITALNPTFLVTWTAALAALNASGLVALAPDRAVPFAGAVFLGILAWFSTLLGLVGRFKGRWNPSAAGRFIQAMGAVLVLAALWMGLRTLGP